jgi:hypothetical protein
MSTTQVSNIIGVVTMTPGINFVVSDVRCFFTTLVSLLYMYSAAPYCCTEQKIKN